MNRSAADPLQLARFGLSYPEQHELTRVSISPSAFNRRSPRGAGDAMEAADSIMACKWRVRPTAARSREIWDAKHLQTVRQARRSRIKRNTSQSDQTGNNFLLIRPRAVVVLQNHSFRPSKTRIFKETN